MTNRRACSAAGVLSAALALASCTSSSGGGPSPSDGPAVGGSFEARPLVMPAQQIGAVRADAFGGISFRLPVTEQDYGKLSGNEKQRLTDALRAVDCAHPPELPNSPDRVACDAAGSIAGLLGPPIVTARDVAAAEPVAPSVSGARWAVGVTFTPAGASSMRAWTTAHHTDNLSVDPIQTAAGAPCGLKADVPCSDFVAFVVGDHAVSWPGILAVLSEVVQIGGNFTQQSATNLAQQISP